MRFYQEVINVCKHWMILYHIYNVCGCCRVVCVFACVTFLSFLRVVFSVTDSWPVQHGSLWLLPHVKNVEIKEL